MTLSPIPKLTHEKVHSALRALPSEVRLQALQELSRQTGGGMFERVPFSEWLPGMSPRFNWKWPYIQHMINHLEMAQRGDMPRLAMSLPPRHGKSTLLVHFVTWLLENDPSMRIILTAYSQTLAELFSGQVRKMLATRIDLSSSRRNIENWETPQGGGVRAAGVGSGVTGMGGQCIVIDDPVKSRKEANSPAYRRRVYDWFTDDLYTRLEPGGIMIGVATRWHEDDLFGRILASKEGQSWKYVSLPAIAELDDPIGRKLGEALNPARFPIKDLDRIKNALGRGWWALYQQRPQEQEGDLFMRSWFQIVSEEEVGTVGMTFCRYWDKASASDGEKAQTAGILMGERNNNYYIFDMKMGDWKAPERENRIKMVALSDTLKYGHVTFGVEQEPGSGGKDSAENTISNLAGYSVFAEVAGTNKVLRAEPLASQASIGRVFLVRGIWNEEFLDIITSFPNADLKDPVDAASGAFKYLSKFSVDWQTLLGVGLVNVKSGRWI